MSEKMNRSGRRKRRRRSSPVIGLALGMILGVALLAIALAALSASGLISVKSLYTFQGQSVENEQMEEKALDAEPQTNALEESETETELQTEEGPLVVIDAGHQGPGQDMSGVEPIAPGSSEMKARIVTGTQGRTSGLPEYQLNLDISLLLQEELEARGYRVLMTRTTNDINIGNIERADVANEVNADILVRIHANGSDNSDVAGALTMISSRSNPYVGHMYDDCYRLASNILNSYCEATGLSNRGIMETDDMTGINWCQMPVTILEMGFMTNPGDDTYMADETNHQTMVEGIANGIDQYFGRE